MKKRLILLNAVIVTIGFITAFCYAAVQIQNQYKKEFTNRLETALAILSTRDSDIQVDPRAVADKVGEELNSSGQEIRISIIALNGKVLGDSAKDEIDENHLNRPEIVQARKEGKGFNTRLSKTIHRPYYYEAIYYPGKYYLRAALPTEELDASIRRLWSIAIFSMFLGILIVCTATGYFVVRVTEPLQDLTAAAEKISGGDFTSRVSGNYTDEAGRLAGSFNVMAQNTENAVQELTRQQNQLEGVLQGMDDGVLAVDRDGKLLFLNQSARRLLGREELTVGMNLKGSLLMLRIAGLMKKAIEKNCENRCELDDEDERKFTVYAAPIPGQQTASALAVVSDVTRLRKLERLRSEFVANVTHELKTPLTSIRGSIELLKSADRDEKTRKYFYDILDIEAERLQHLIDDMLALSQIENAKDDPSARPCELKGAVAECLERYRPDAEKNQVRLHENAESGLYVSCSPTRLQQLLGNLVENAIKYNVPQGSVTVTAARQKQTAVIRVCDTGIGIAPKHFERLFERFYRVDTSRSRKIGGTGLGLSIVKHLAVLYGGDVNVESKVGEGSTFTVRLPLLSEQEIRERISDEKPN